MRKVYIAETCVEAHLVKGLFESKGISVIVTGGDVSMSDPTVWVADDAPHELIQEVIASFSPSKETHESSYREEWRCSKCGEQIEPQFIECWRCGAYQPA